MLVYSTGNYSFSLSYVTQKPVALKLDKKKITLPVDKNSKHASLVYPDGSTMDSIATFKWESSNKVSGTKDQLFSAGAFR